MSSDTPISNEAPSRPLLGDRTYDYIKFLAQIVLPVIGTLYFGLAQLWGFPHAAEVVGTITLIDTALGGLLSISSAGYRRSNDPNAGSLVQVGSHPETGMPHLALTLNKTPDELMEKNTITLKVEDR